MQIMGMSPLEARLLKTLRHIESLGSSPELSDCASSVSDAITALQAIRYVNSGGSTAWGLDGEPNPIERDSELLAKQLKTMTEGDVNGSIEGLKTCLNMIDTYTADALPANEHGQVHFARAMLQSTADELRAYLAKQ